MIENTPGAMNKETGEYDRAKLKELQPAEIKIAVADAQCRKDIDLDQVMLKLRFDREQEFIDAHLPQLEGFRAALIEAMPQ